MFPNFVTNKAAMVCSGLLPIDELKDWRSPGSLVCQRIKRSVLEAQVWCGLHSVASGTMCVS